MLAHQIDQDISLELVEPRHANELFAVTDANRAHLRLWLPWVDRTQSSDDTNTFIEVAQRQLTNSNGCHTVIRYGQTLVGVVGYHKIDWSNRSASIGYWLAESAQGQGIMTKSCRTHIDHMIDDLGLQHLWLVHPWFTSLNLNCAYSL